MKYYYDLEINGEYNRLEMGTEIEVIQWATERFLEDMRSGDYEKNFSNESRDIEVLKIDIESGEAVERIERTIWER